MSECLDKALDLLANRPHFRFELGAKLARRDFAADEIEATLDRLAAEGYVDDAETARQFVAERRKRNRWGRRRLRAELRKRGAASTAVDEALAEIETADELELARRDVELWLARRRGGTERATLARRLERRGFSSRVIVEVLERHADELDRS